jgi:hypothetical protein
MADKPLTAADILAGAAGPVHYAGPATDPRWSAKGRDWGTQLAGPWASPTVSGMLGDVGEAVGGTAGSMFLHDIPYNLQEAGQRIRAGQYGQAVGPLLASIPIVPGAGPAAEDLVGQATRRAVESIAKKTPKDLPQVTWNPETRAWEGGPVKSVPMEPPAHVSIPDIYDTTSPELAKVPNVPQVEFQRYEPKGGTSQRVQDLMVNEAVKQKMLEAIQRGLPVGMSWHNAQPAIQDAIDALGSEEAGREAFKKYIDYNAATSSLKAVPTNLREASYYYWRDKAGLGPSTIGETPPDPYHGGLAVQGHQKAANQVLAGTWGQGDVSKTPSYGANLEGNLTPVAVDRHAMRAPGMLAEDPRFLLTKVPKTDIRPQDLYNAGQLSMEDALKQPTYWTDMPAKNEYASMEDYYQDLARQANMAPGQAQASGWVGNAELTGVETDPTKTWLQMYQDRIKNTAYRTGQSAQDVVRNFWQGQHPLLSVGAPVATGGAMLPALQGGQSPQQQQQQWQAIGSSPEFDDWWQRAQGQGPSA